MAREKKEAEKKTGVAGWNESVGTPTRKEAAGAHGKKVAADRRRRICMLVVLLLVCIASVVCFWPVKERITRGLWLKEGTSVGVQVAGKDGSAATSGDVSAAVSTISSRLAQIGISEYAVSDNGDNTLSICLTRDDAAKGIAKIVGGAGVIEFVRADEIGDADALVKVNAGTKNVLLDKGTYTPFMDNSSVASAQAVSAGDGTYAVGITFTEDGASKFAEVTKELAEDSGRIAIVIDRHVVSAPSVSEEISGGEVYISGDYTADEANALRVVLSGKPIDVDLTVGDSEEIQALVGKTMLWGMVGLAVALFAGISIYAFSRYRKLALLLVGGMAVFAVLMLGIMALASRLDMFVLTIPGVIGGTCAAVATVVAIWSISEGFRNRAQEGKSIKGAATSVPREALRLVQGPVAVAFVFSLVFLFLPQPFLREFGTVYVFGVVCGIAAVFWYAITLLRLVAMGSVQNNPGAWGITVAPTQDSTEEGAV